MKDPRKNEINPKKVNPKKQRNNQNRNRGFNQITFVWPGNFF
jgi:hypothetical protein